MVGTIERKPAGVADVDLGALESIQRRVLWLSSAPTTCGRTSTA
jgi:hypothetical protein